MTLIQYIYRVSGLDKMKELEEIVENRVYDEINYDAIDDWARKHGLKADKIRGRNDVGKLIMDAEDTIESDPAAVCGFGVWVSVHSFKNEIEFALADVVVKYPALTQPEDYYVAVIWD